ncbi:MAG: dihydroorotate dehydrogenase catalytic subunit [Thermotogaceae bacterium]|jgi:dihydroorotate dehydrogenase (NAD+) catalytic subunit|nr:dihydroorotate dehydrogenase catalytic subunit [Thermotogaceae bacterium]MDN5337095.1 dihydroorotate dehydrogenase catalytic subunit [Thermotogaceae bacterium]
MLVKPPLVLLSGPAGFGEWLELIDKSFIGALTLKTITLNPKEGNKPSRMAEGNNYIINRIGLENPGVLKFLEMLDTFKNLKSKIILSLGGDTVEEYLKIAETIKPYSKEFDAIEFNFSCPNVEKGGLSIVGDLQSWEKIIKTVRKILPDSFLIAKLGIEGIFVENAADILVNNDWNGITLINTVRGLHFENGKIILGGLSGPLLKPIALRAVYEVRKRFSDIFIIASGGIYNSNDAEEFMKVGASAIGIGSALFKSPEIVEEIGKKLMEVERSND